MFGLQLNELTAFGLVVLFALAGVYDAWAALTGGYPATITAVVREAAARWSVIPFLAGALAAHLFGW